MEYRQLGRSGLRVSTITLGTMGFGGTGWAGPIGRIDVEGARRQIAICRDAGVNLIDTADVYSAGLSEQILGEALGKDRDEVLIATKVRGEMGDGPERRRALAPPHHRARARRACAGSAPTTSTSTRCTSGTGSPRSRRPSPRSTPWCGRARSATSVPRTTPPASS